MSKEATERVAEETEEAAHILKLIEEDAAERARRERLRKRMQSIPERTQEDIGNAKRKAECLDQEIIEKSNIRTEHIKMKSSQ